jgi:serine/threonine protein kinase
MSEPVMSEQGSHPTAPYLPGGGKPADDVLEDPRIFAVVQEYMAQLESGRTPDRAAYVNRFPELSDAIRQCLEGLEIVRAEAPASQSAATRGRLATAQQPGIDVPANPLGDFQIIRELARGGMGIVYEAVQLSLGRRVALKVLPFAATMDPRQLQRFHNEVRAAASLDHPHIVHVHAVGCERGVHFYAMQLIEGQTLAAMIADLRQRGGRPALPEAQPTTPHLPGQPDPASPLADTAPRAAASTERGPRDRAYFRRVAEWGVQAAEALDYAHQTGIVHRDIKPANLMLTPDDTVKVTDFGTAKILQFGTVQQTSHVMGTPSYMSPEQVKGRAVDGRSDIFSLGVMLYEMVTGGKPFPAESITTVIYKIVNEDPISPRQLNPSIHPGLSEVVMKALAKEPEARYQSCRELLDDLKNYRNLGSAGGNPEATMVSGLPNVTLAAGPAGGRWLKDDTLAAAASARALSARAANPMQTPTLRRTGPVTPYEAPKKKGVVGTVFAALFLLGVIVYGGFKLLPVFQATRQQNAAMTSAAKGPDAQVVAPATSDPATRPDGNQNPTVEPVKESVSDASPATPTAPPGKLAEEKIDSRIAASALNPTAAEYKGRIEEAVSEKGMSARVKVQGSGNTLILAGRLRPTEHGELLKFMRGAPASVHIVDHIEYDDAPIPSVDNADSGGHPVPKAGYGAIHVVTDVLGATAVLHDPAGRAVNQCNTPCSFNDLQPANYSLEVRKQGYQSMQTALQVKAGAAMDQKVALESLAKGLLISTRPPGADVFINGDKQSGQTPVTLPLRAGNYNLVLRLPGYQAYAEKVQVEDNIQTQVTAELTQKSADHVAWAQVTTTPKGAEIFIDGSSTGQYSPARVQVPSGVHTITLKLNGFEPVQRIIQMTEGGSVHVDASLNK